MGYISKIKDTGGTSHPVAHNLYGTCSTAAGTAAKVVTCTNWDTAKANIPTGTTISIKFTNSNTAGSPTLNINNKGAIGIYKYDTDDSNIRWHKNSVVTFTYDGSYWLMNNYTDMVYQSDNGTDNTLHHVLFGGTGITGETGTIYKSSKFLYANNALQLGPPFARLCFDIESESGGGFGYHMNIQDQNNNTTYSDLTLSTGDSFNVTLTSPSGIFILANSGTSSSTKIQMSNGYFTMKGNLSSGSGTAIYLNSNNEFVKYSSSRRYKTNIDYNIDKQDYHNQLMNFKPCEYEYISTPGEQNFGLIAEDVYDVNPQLVNYDSDFEIESFRDRDILTMLVLEAQEKDKEISELKQEVEDLKYIVNQLTNSQGDSLWN